jgi:hypothetical protein
LNFALEYAIRSVRVNKASLKLNGTHQLLVYTDDVNIVGGSIHTIRKNTEALVIASLKVNGEKSTYVVMSGDQNAGKITNMQTGNKSVETVEQFKYL